MAQSQQKQHEMKETPREAPHVTVMKDSPKTSCKKQQTPQTKSKGSGGFSRRGAFLRGCSTAILACCVVDCIF